MGLALNNARSFVRNEWPLGITNRGGAECDRCIMALQITHDPPRGEFFTFTPNDLGY